MSFLKIKTARDSNKSSQLILFWILDSPIQNMIILVSNILVLYHGTIFNAMSFYLEFYIVLCHHTYYPWLNSLIDRDEL